MDRTISDEDLSLDTSGRSGDGVVRAAWVAPRRIKLSSAYTLTGGKTPYPNEGEVGSVTCGPIS